MVSKTFYDLFALLQSCCHHWWMSWFVLPCPTKPISSGWADGMCRRSYCRRLWQGQLQKRWNKTLKPRKNKSTNVAWINSWTDAGTTVTRGNKDFTVLPENQLHQHLWTGFEMYQHVSTQLLWTFVASTCDNQGEQKEPVASSSAVLHCDQTDLNHTVSETQACNQDQPRALETLRWVKWLLVESICLRAFAGAFKI